MDIEQEREVIETRFRDCWMLGDPDTLETQVGFDGHAFQPPTDESSVRLSILNGESFNASMGSPGSNLVRSIGVVHIQIYVPGGKASSFPSVEWRRLANKIRPIFTNWKSGGLLFRTMSVGSRQENKPLFKQPVTFPFQRDEFNG